MGTAMTESILTRRQFAEREHRRLAAEYPDTTLAEITTLYPSDGQTIQDAWWSDVTAHVEAGDLPSTRLWRSLNNWQQRDLLRTRRALQDEEFTRALIARSHVHDARAKHGGPMTRIPSKVTCPSCKAARGLTGPEAYE